MALAAFTQQTEQEMYLLECQTDSLKLDWKGSYNKLHWLGLPIYLDKLLSLGIKIHDL